jgi:GNAT superfamily N-acetyltransferase
MTPEDIDVIYEAEAAAGSDEPRSTYERFLRQQHEGRRVVFLAFWEGSFAGYVTVVWTSDYPPFREAGIPEINAFEVLPGLRRRGIGSRLMDEAEALVATRSPIGGIAVGMTPDYGPAQRMYVLRGYVPDGLGVWSHDHRVALGESLKVDHELYLALTKQLRRQSKADEAIL